MKTKVAYHVHNPGRLVNENDETQGAYCVECNAVIDAPKSKRVKKVFKSDEVAHIWAQQKLAEGRNPQGNVFFEGPKIYSYGHHFEMARFIAPGVVLITTRRYSATTAGHLSALHGAVSHCKSFEVPSFDDHNVNADYYATGILERVETIRRSRTGFDWSLKGLADFRAEAERFLAMFKKNVSADRRRKLSALIKKEFFTPGDLLAFKEREARAAETAKRSRETRRRNESLAWKLRHQASCEASRTKDEATAHAEALADAVEEHWYSEIEEGLKAAWIAGDERGRTRYNDPVMLRMMGDEIETSQYARVPIGRAVELFSDIRAGRDIQGFEIGHYTVTGIHDGKLVIGCHRIPMREVLRMARTLGLDTTGAQEAI